MTGIICNVFFLTVFSIGQSGKEIESVRNLAKNESVRNLAINDIESVRNLAMNNIESVRNRYFQKYNVEFRDIFGLYKIFTKDSKYQGTAIKENWSKSEGHINSVFYISIFLYGLIFLVLYWGISLILSYCAGNSDLSWYFTTISRLIIMPVALITYFELFINSVIEKRDCELMRLTLNK